MTAFPPALSYYDISYSSRPSLLRGARRRPLTPEEVTETCESLLAWARHHKCAYWLLDGRMHDHPQPAELHAWMQEEYFPRVSQEMGSVVSIAFMVTPTILHQLVDLGYQDLRNSQIHGVRMGWFTNEEEAQEWLDRQRVMQVPSDVLSI